MPKVLQMPGLVRRQRDIWRDELRRLPLEKLVELLGIRFLNDIDVAARRGKYEAKMPIAADTFSEFTYADMKKVDAVIEYLAKLLRPAGVLVLDDRNEVVAGPSAIVTTDAIATHTGSMKLKAANLTRVRALLREARKRRDQMVA